MPNPNMAAPHDKYDPRWFIWTIVFLLVSGVSLISYILLSEPTSADDGIFLVHQQKIHKAK